MQDVRWPTLEEPYRGALAEAVALLFERFELRVIVASGSILRGNPDASSDLDIVAIQRAPFRQRIQRWFNGVPAELFVNALERLPRSFEEDRRFGRPSLAHMLATGVMLYDPEGIASELTGQAMAVLDKGPDFSADELQALHYGPATWFEDAADLAARDPALCRLALHHAVEDAVRYRYLAANRWRPRFKELISGLAELDPALHAEVERFFAATALAAQLASAEAIVLACVGETGFFEWESEPERI
jgi:hypothetical protein